MEGVSTTCVGTRNYLFHFGGAHVGQHVPVSVRASKQDWYLLSPWQLSLSHVMSLAK